MNIEKYAYLNLNIQEVDNIIELLHNKTDIYLELIDNGEHETVEYMKSLMREYMQEIRTQTNILTSVKFSLQDKNNMYNGFNKVTRADFKKKLLNVRHQ